MIFYDLLSKILLISYRLSMQALQCMFKDNLNSATPSSYCNEFNLNHYFCNIFPVFTDNSLNQNLILFFFLHSFQYLLHYLKFLKDWFEPYKWETTPVARSAWTFLKDSYHGTLCLRHKPQHIAVGLIYMALECHGVEVPLQTNVTVPWYKVSYVVFYGTCRDYEQGYRMLLEARRNYVQQDTQCKQKSCIG